MFYGTQRKSKLGKKTKQKSHACITFQIFETGNKKLIPLMASITASHF